MIAAGGQMFVGMIMLMSVGFALFVASEAVDLLVPWSRWGIDRPPVIVTAILSVMTVVSVAGVCWLVGGAVLR